MVQLEDPEAKEPVLGRPVILLYGDEDGNEPDGSWVVDGALRWLISGAPEAVRLRKRATFLLIPLFDPDGFSAGSYEQLAESLMLTDPKAKPPAETLAYTAFIDKWMAAQRRLDIVCAFHNVECEECPNVQCPISDWRRAKAMRAMNEFVLSRLPGLTTSPKIWMTGFLDQRFCGWCNRHFGSIISMYEINSRFPTHRLSLAQLQAAGPLFCAAFADYLASPGFAALAPEIDHKRSTHYMRLLAYLKQRKPAGKPRTPYETMVLGY